MKFRDILAVPLWVLALLLDLLAVKVGGTWTSQMYAEQYVKTGKIFDEHHE